MFHTFSLPARETPLPIASSYEFEELPLLTEGKNGGLFAYGVAQIKAYDEDDWYVTGVQIDGIEIDAREYQWLWDNVCSAIYRDCSEAIRERLIGEFGDDERPAPRRVSFGPAGPDYSRFQEP